MIFSMLSSFQYENKIAPPSRPSRSSLYWWQDFTSQLLNSVFFLLSNKMQILWYIHASFSLRCLPTPLFSLLFYDHIHSHVSSDLKWRRNGEKHVRKTVKKNTQNVRINKWNSEEKKRISNFFPNLLKNILKRSQKKMAFLSFVLSLDNRFLSGPLGKCRRESHNGLGGIM